MAMIEIDLGEFVDGLIAKKARAGAIDETQRVGERRELLTIADKAIDVAIMRAVLLGAFDRTIGTRTMDRLHDLMKAGAKAHTLRYLRQVLPDWEEVIAVELAKFEKMYLEDSPR
jgi:methionine aminopeptidase